MPAAFATAPCTVCNAVDYALPALPTVPADARAEFAEQCRDDCPAAHGPASDRGAPSRGQTLTMERVDVVYYRRRGLARPTMPRKPLRRCSCKLTP